MIALPIPPEGQWSETHRYMLADKPPGEIRPTTREPGLPVKGWVQDCYIAGFPSRIYVRLYHAKSGELRWLKLLPAGGDR